MIRKLLLMGSHGLMLSLGFVLGIYFLPIVTAPPSPDVEKITDGLPDPRYTASFSRDLEGSDFLHWGEGEAYLFQDRVVFRGSLAPGPDYRLYFSTEWVETEADFERLKGDMREAGLIRTFRNFVVLLPDDLDIDRYSTVVVWCESFGQFISAARYR